GRGRPNIRRRNSVNIWHALRRRRGFAVPELDRDIYHYSAHQQAAEFRNEAAPSQAVESQRIRAGTDEIEITVLHRKAEAHKKLPEAIHASVRDALGQHLEEVAPK